jgi:pyruvate carboxylase subunit B
MTIEISRQPSRQLKATSPVHTLDGFVELGKKLAGMGCDSLAIKDMAGLLIPSVTVDLYHALSKATGLSIHIHSHTTSGLANICQYQAILAGCHHVDTAISSFSGGASHPSTESLVAALIGTEFDTELDLNLLLEIDNYFKMIRKKYHQYESEARDMDPRVQLYQVPGGMISNLYSQLKEQNALDQIDKVHEEIPRVRKDLGYPPLVTPTSQIVGTQAVINVLAGERYKTITNEVKLYCQGKYGIAPGKISPRLRKKAIGQTDVIEVRPADLIPNELEHLKQEIGSLVSCEEDILTYAMFPEVGRQFLEQRQNNSLTPEALLPDPSSSTETSGDLSEYDIILHGEQYHVKVAGFSTPRGNQRSCFLWVDGVPEEVIVHRTDFEEEILIAQKNSVSPGDISVLIPGTIIAVQVKEGEKVKKGQTLLVLEAMKMETEIQAPDAGEILEVRCQKGDKVTPDQVLIKINFKQK